MCISAHLFYCLGLTELDSELKYDSVQRSMVWWINSVLSVSSENGQ